MSPEMSGGLKLGVTGVVLVPVVLNEVVIFVRGSSVKVVNLAVIVTTLLVNPPDVA